MLLGLCAFREAPGAAQRMGPQGGAVCAQAWPWMGWGV